MSSSPNQLDECIVLAGGLGTRLQSVVSDRPKPMATIEDRPFIEYLLDYLIAQGIRHAVLSVGYRSDAIVSYFGDNYGALSLSYAVEEQPLGTGGAIRHSMQFVSSEHVAVVNGDSIFIVNLDEQFQFHLAKGADVTFALRYLEDFDRFGSVALGEAGRILRFREKQHVDKGYINGGVYIFNKGVFEATELPVRFSIERDFFEPNAQSMKFYGKISDGYFLDIGTPEDYSKAHAELRQQLSGGDLSRS